MAEGSITEEGIARLRARIGIPEPHTVPVPRYTSPGVDAFRHVAEAYGDDNPLWSDEAYAAGTCWDGVIAPPPLVGGDTLIGFDEVPEVPEAHRALMKGDPLRGVHAFYSASAREWWAPLRPEPAASRGATPWWACSRSRASSPAAPCTNGWPRRSAKSTAPCSRRSTG